MMHSSRLLLFCLLLTLLAAGSVRASEAALEPLPKVLTLDAAIARFRQHGYDLLVAEAAIQSAEGDVAIAGAVPNPGVSGSVGKSYQLGGGQGLQPYGPPAFSVGLNDNNAISEVLFGKRGLRKDVAHAALEAARGSRKDAERTLLFQLRQQFLQTLQAKAVLLLDVQNQDTAATFLELTAKRYRLGAISEADLARVETAKLESDQAVDTANQNLLQAKAALAFYLGVRGAAPDFDVDGPQFVHYAAPPALPETSLERLIALAQDNRPDLKALHAQIDSAEAALHLARRQRLPDFGLNLGYAVQGASGQGQAQVTPPTFTLGLSTTLPLFYFQQGEVQKASAALRTQKLLAAKLEAQVTADVTAAYAAFTASAQLALRMETGGLLERSRRARDLVSIQYQKGSASLLDILTAQQTFNAVQIEYTQDITNYWTSVFQLEQATALEKT